MTEAVHQAAELLPNQAILENFVHHNPLEHLQSLPFQEALGHVRELERYRSPGERVHGITNVDPRKRVNESLVDLASVFLDKGAAKWTPSYRHKGFLYFFAAHERLGYGPWRRLACRSADRILPQLTHDPAASHALAEELLKENLDFFGIPPAQWPSALRSMMLELPGWAGMFHRMEEYPNEQPPNTAVHLIDFCAVQSILLRSSITDLARHSGWSESSQPFSEWIEQAPALGPSCGETETHHPSALAYVDQSSSRREELEQEFEQTLLRAIGTNDVGPPPSCPELQLYTCIDDREGSLRRHVESPNPSGTETFGVAGFFGIPIRFKPADGRDEMILAPEGQNPPTLLVEDECVEEHEQTVKYNRRRRWFARSSIMWENASFSPVGSLFLSMCFPASVTRLLLIGFSPKYKQKVRDQTVERFLRKPRTSIQIPFPPDQAAEMLARTFNDIGTQGRFAPTVVILGHGSVSVNNPYSAAYNCGACGGREGAANARLLARMANDPEIRSHLNNTHDICIPEDTLFIGGVHNTTNDGIELFDVESLPPAQTERVQQLLDEARGKNSLERCHRFLLAQDVHTPQQALQHVQTRAVDSAEARPELNHATNAAVVVGRRELTKGHFLDRRVFLPSYDPGADDDLGTNLEHVLGPAIVVCSGINLEYLFSTIDVDHHGAGTKAPLNIVGNIGVLQGTAGDLRPGLPTQMTEMHTPVRALFVVDAPIARVEAVLSRRKELADVIRNEWVRLFVRDPTTNQFFKQEGGEYRLVEPVQEGTSSSEYVSFDEHLQHGRSVVFREQLVYYAGITSMLLACGVPITMFGAEAMNPLGPQIAVCGTMLSLPVLSFSRRYLHGEFMFPRFAQLSAGLLLGFNLVAVAPTLEHAMLGWSLFGFSSTFLIGAYNDRPTVRNNATYAFAAYRISDFALLISTTLLANSGVESHPGVAAGLLLAAICKSSQFPLTSLFVRSMEGPTPASALGYAGLSAHVGVVLLSGTMPLWFEFDWARATLGSIGLFTSVYGTLAGKIRADRKGSIANATSASIGLIFCTLALGHSDLALLMSLGHASFRMIQILRSPNNLADSQNMRGALGAPPWPKVVPDWLYQLCWRVRRTDTDFHLLNVLHSMSRKITPSKKRKFTKLQQWAITGGSVVVAGMPFTPFSDYLEHSLMELIPTQPVLAGAIMVAHFGVSVGLIRFLLMNVLSAQRFRKPFQKKK